MWKIFSRYWWSHGLTARRENQSVRLFLGQKFSVNSLVQYNPDVQVDKALA
jgi:hypothetical protein